MGDMDDFFLDSFEWRDRLKRTLLYPGNQSIDFTMPIQVSGKKKVQKISHRDRFYLFRIMCEFISVIRAQE